MVSSSTFNSLIILLTTTTLLVLVSARHEYKVGDENGWIVPPDNDAGFYSSWASKIKFLVGDSLVFEYKNDSVVKVNKRGYYHCNETNRDLTFNDGKTRFVLEKPGFYYFVSGDAQHCQRGERLMVEVAGSLGPSPSSLPNKADTFFVSYVFMSVALLVGLSG